MKNTIITNKTSIRINILHIITIFAMHNHAIYFVQYFIYNIIYLRRPVFIQNQL